ncbi:REP-associated tyrosine transposase [Pseudomonas sp. EA_105y_Pfl2_R69]|uniref:REP-associated tyrosine transposase n=1 Tax=Pseudomonas sp. EA_105y_Pfl2_R69 TaxID=3088683 RepID=UPI0030D7C3D1
MPAKSHGSNLRRGRYSEPERLYLLTSVLLQRRPLFNDFALARLLVKELRVAHEQQQVASLAWVVMPDHLHWLVQLQTGSLEQLMRRIKSKSARQINQYLGTQGPIWQQGYHDRALRKDEGLQSAALYIVANPLRAGLVKRIGNYPLWDAVWL